ncbi:hypothetical protein WMY93_007349 [Mugilogobius chulae]|uniref:Gypsy retrotransposon integrase-like protein 1 n=1 Tax=Mugilogobius chulae TaxID=88201 RepID=A0AAW0PCQ4_9GOBI
MLWPSRALEGGESVEVARALVTVGRGRIPVRVRNVRPYALTLSRFQRLATVSAINPDSVRNGKELSMAEVGPGVIEVGLVDAVQEPPELGETTAGLSFPEGDGLTEDEQRRLNQLLHRWRNVFSMHEEDYGRTGAVKHQIPTGDANPIRERFRPVPPTLYKEIRSLLKDMLDGGVVRESCSPGQPPLSLFRKEWRLAFCVDYRKLNSVTHKDAYPLPRIEDSLTSLTKAEWYSTLDLASGYWQVEVEERDREKTAFTTPFGLFEFERMPFGLCNAPATFQRLMQRCLGEQLAESAMVYLDDVIVYSASFTDHLHHLETIFQSLYHYGLKLQPEKCQFLKRQVKFLGHVVCSQGISPDPDKVAAVSDWKPPTTVRQVRSFLGFVGYYRRFIKDFSKIAKPLNGLLIGTGRSRGRRSPPIEWTEQCEAAFQRLKHELLQAPILAYANYNLPFVLYTDASNSGLGAVLAQEQDGVERVIAYASRSLHPAERNDANYSSFKLELLAMKWAVVEKFKDYLWGMKFSVVTDNNPLVHLQTAKLGAVEQRWVAQLANFDYTIRYRPGRENTNADVLSRLPVLPDQASRGREQLVGAVGATAPLPDPPSSRGWDVDRWRSLQAEDPDLCKIKKHLEQGMLPNATERQSLMPPAKTLLRHWKKLELRSGVVCRTVQDPQTLETLHQIVVPISQAQLLWTAYHERMGHPGLEKSLALLRRNFYWPQMEELVNTWLSACPRCLLHKPGPQGYTPAYLMFGRHMRTPVDLLVGGLGSDTSMDTAEWVAKHHAQLTYAYQRTADCLYRAGQKNKRLYDRTAKEAPLLPGERVLVQDHRRRQAGKLGDRWESRLYVVISRLHPESPNYKIRPEGKDGPVRVVHRNHLRPCPHLRLSEPDLGSHNESRPSEPMWGLVVPVGGGDREELAPPPEPRRSQRANMGPGPRPDPRLGARLESALGERAWRARLESALGERAWRARLESALGECTDRSSDPGRPAPAVLTLSF